MKFSTSGKYLAAACTLESGKTVVKIFDCEDGVVVIIVRGHHDLVHDICWSKDDRFFVTAGSDGAVRIWHLNDRELENSDRFNYHDNDRLFFVVELHHPSFVYGAQIAPFTDDQYLFVATICYDGKVRVWLVNANIDYLEETYAECQLEMDINDKPNRILGTKKSVYEYEENLEDDTLRLIMNPQDQTNDF